MEPKEGDGTQEGVGAEEAEESQMQKWWKRHKQGTTVKVEAPKRSALGKGEDPLQQNDAWAGK
eukprot:6504346-Alexandrium_andersonii.AAC.1